MGSLKLALVAPILTAIAFKFLNLISINKLIEELSTIALAEFDANTRFKAMASMGKSEEGLRILDKLDVLL